MRKWTIVFCFLMVFVSSVASAQKFTIDFGISLAGSNLSTRVGDVYHYSEVLRGGTDRGITDFYGVTRESIAPSLSGKPSFSLRFGYESTGSWGILFDVSRISTNGSTFGRVTSKEGGPEEVYVSGVCLWGQCLVPVQNQKDPTWFSPVEYSASNSISVNSVRLLATYSKQRAVLRLLGGVSCALYRNNRSEQERQRSFIYDYLGDGYHWDNFISLTSTEEAKATLVGPTVGVQVRFEPQDRGVSFTGELTQSVLFGSMNERGLWVDIDDIYEISGSYFEYKRRFMYLEGNFPYNTSEQVGISVTTLGAKISYRLWEALSIGLGGNLAVWYDTPVAPSWNVPGRWTALAGSGWQSSRETIVFANVGVTLGVNF